jgi:hypothetical protein
LDWIGCGGFEKEKALGTAGNALRKKKEDKKKNKKKLLQSRSPPFDCPSMFAQMAMRVGRQCKTYFKKKKNIIVIEAESHS